MQWLRDRAALTILVVGLTLSTTVALLLARAERASIDRRFDAAVERAGDAIVGGLGDSVDLLRPGAGLFAASEQVTADEFATFVASLDLPTEHPEISGYAAMASVDAADLPALTAAVRELGAPTWEVRPPTIDGATTRRPILFIEPTVTNAAAVGFDVMANPLAQAATDRAAATGAPAMTAPLTLVQEAEDQAGFVIYNPIASPDEGQALGRPSFVSAVHRGDDFLAGVFAASDTPARVIVRDVAGGGPAEDGTVGTWAPGSFTGEEGRAGTISREVLGRTWLVEVTAVPGAFGTPSPAPWAAGLLGILASLWAAGLFRSVQHREADARRIASDLTSDLRAEQRRAVRAAGQLAVANDELEASNEELQRFAYVASHDLQEPLRMVSSFLGLLEHHLGDDLDEDGREYLGFATRGAERMSRLITDLLVLSRVERAVTTPSTVDVAATVSDVLTVLGPRIAATDATVEVVATTPVEADETQLVQLLQNLVGNALKFQHADRTPHVRIQAHDVDGDWHLTVSDNGIGVEPGHRERIFDAFARLHARDEFEGTGIGLAVCHRVARAHGGTITASDGIDGGLTITVVLPGAARPATSAPTPVAVPG